MMYLKKILINIINTGVNDSHELNDKFKIRFINGLHLLIILILTIGITHWILMNKHIFIILEAFCILLAITGIVLNYYHKVYFSFILFVVYCNILIVYNIEFYPIEIAGFVYYFPFIMALGIFRLSFMKDALIDTLLIISFIIFLLVIFLDFYPIIPQYLIVPFSHREIIWVRNLNIIIATLCVVLFTYFYIWFSNVQKKEIDQLLQFKKNSQSHLLDAVNKKDLLLSQVHQRVQDNLLLFQKIILSEAKNTHPDNLNHLLNEIQNKIVSMSTIHQLLYTSPNTDAISVKDFLEKIITIHNQNNDNKINIISNYQYNPTIKIYSSLPLGIIFSDLLYHISNHTKFNSPEFILNVYMSDSNLHIQISNDFSLQNFFDENALGIRLLHNMLHQINGKIELYNQNFFQIKIIIPKSEWIEV